MRLSILIGFMLLLVALPLPLVSQHDMANMPGMSNMHDMSQMGDMAAPQELSPAMAAKLEADKRFSEFNHRFAGLFVLLIGVLTWTQPALEKRLGSLRYLWCVLFFIPGIYLFFYSDPESWPTGNQTLYHVITVNHQVLQHKVFSLLLLGLALVEYLRVREKLDNLWASAAFPLMAGAGAVLLLFHQHPGPAGVPMTAVEHLSMQKVEHQHLGFAVVGFGIALSKAAVDTKKFNEQWARNLFALLMAALGVLLLTYVE